MTRKQIQDLVIQYIRENDPREGLAEALEAICNSAPDDAPAIMAMISAFRAGVIHGRADGVV